MWDGKLMAGRKRAEMMEETRRKLLQAARQAFAEKGYAASSMDELTADVGLTRGALYHNFGDKTGLLGRRELLALIAPRAVFDKAGGFRPGDADLRPLLRRLGRVRRL